MSVHNDDIGRNDDHEWEGYLKQFQPAIPEPLPLQIMKTRRRAIMRIVWVSAAASVLIAGVLMREYKFSPKRMVDMPRETQTLPLTGLTIGDANHLLAESSSIAEALDTIAYAPQSSFPQGTSSALATLGKEDFK